MVVASGDQPRRLVTVDKLATEEHGLLPGPVSQLAAADAPRESEVIADHGAGTGLAADRVPPAPRRRRGLPAAAARPARPEACPRPAPGSRARSGGSAPTRSPPGPA